MEGFSGINSVLAGHGIHHEQGFPGAHAFLMAAISRIIVFVDGQSAGGIDNYHGKVLVLCILR